MSPNNYARDLPEWFTYLKLAIGIFGDGATFYGAYLLAKEALSKGHSVSFKENALKGLKLLVSRGLGPKESRNQSAEWIIEQSEAKRIVELARVGVIWIALGFSFQVVGRVLEILGEVWRTGLLK